MCYTSHGDQRGQKQVTVVSKPSVRSPPSAVVVFTCNGLAVEHVDSFEYLGLHFHTSGGISHLTAPLKAKEARSWGVVQQWHSQLQCGNIVYLKLQSILVPALRYGGQLWGMHTPTGEGKAAQADLQSIHDTFLNAFVGSSMPLGLYLPLQRWKNWLCHLCKSFGGSRL